MDVNQVQKEDFANMQEPMGVRAVFRALPVLQKSWRLRMFCFLAMMRGGQEMHLTSAQITELIREVLQRFAFEFQIGVNDIAEYLRVLLEDEEASRV